MVLKYWISKFILISIDILSPMFTILSANDYALIGLGLNHEYSINRDYHRVHLRSVSIIIQ